MLKEWTKGINLKKLAVTTVVLFIFTMVSDMVVHGWWLAENYRETASLWRSQADMKMFWSWMTAGQILASVLFTFIFAKGYNGTGPQEGFRYGILIGLFLAAQNFIMYTVIPMPNNLMWSWVLAGMVQCILAGVLASLVYGTKTSRPSKAR